MKTGLIVHLKIKSTNLQKNLLFLFMFVKQELRSDSRNHDRGFEEFVLIFYSKMTQPQSVASTQLGEIFLKFFIFKVYCKKWYENVLKFWQLYPVLVFYEIYRNENIMLKKPQENFVKRKEWNQKKVCFSFVSFWRKIPQRFWILNEALLSFVQTNCPGMCWFLLTHIIATRQNVGS